VADDIAEMLDAAAAEMRRGGVLTFDYPLLIEAAAELRVLRATTESIGAYTLEAATELIVARLRRNGRDWAADDVEWLFDHERDLSTRRSREAHRD